MTMYGERRQGKLDRRGPSLMERSNCIPVGKILQMQLNDRESKGWSEAEQFVV